MNLEFQGPSLGEVGGTFSSLAHHLPWNESAAVDRISTGPWRKLPEASSTALNSELCKAMQSPESRAAVSAPVDVATGDVGVAAEVSTP